MENDGPGLFLELSQGTFTVNRALLAQNLSHQFKTSIVGEFSMNNSILYANRAPAVSLKDVEVQRSLAETLWYLRTDEHAKQHIVVPAAFKLNGNVLLAEGPLTSMFTEHIGINRQNPWYDLADKAYTGTGNLFHSERGNLNFAYVNRSWQTRTADLTGWQSHTREKDPVLLNPGFVDPANFDFRLRHNSPLQDRSEELPARKLDPEKISEAKRFRDWANRGIVLDGRDPAVRIKEE
jgi:hypothetical protein